MFSYWYQNLSSYYYYDAATGGGGGGGGGGTFIFATTGTLTVNGSINVNGGNGGSGGNGSRSLICGDQAGHGGGGGAGGAGGFIVLQATSVNVTGSVQARGGNGGAGGSGGKDPCNQATGAVNGFVGGGGGGGRIAVISPNPVQGVTPSNGSNASGSTGGTPTVAIQEVAACTPTITSIQVNGQATNTTIAGTSGSISIYGSCLGSATSVQSDGSGLDLTSISYTADGRVDVSFEVSSSATLGVHNVTVTTVNGTNVTSSAAQVIVTSGPPTISTNNTGIWWLGPNFVPIPEEGYYDSTRLSLAPGGGQSAPTADRPASWVVTPSSALAFLRTDCVDPACAEVDLKLTGPPVGCFPMQVTAQLNLLQSNAVTVVADQPLYVTRVDAVDETWSFIVNGVLPIGYQSTNTLLLKSSCDQIMFNISVHEEFEPWCYKCGGSVGWDVPVPQSGWASWRTQPPGRLDVGQFPDTIGFAVPSTAPPTVPAVQCPHDDCARLGPQTPPFKQPLSQQVNAGCQQTFYVGSRTFGRGAPIIPTWQVLSTDHGRTEPWNWSCPVP